MVILIVLAVGVIGGVVYYSTTRPCRTGWHRYRHWRWSNRGL